MCGATWDGLGSLKLLVLHLDTHPFKVGKYLNFFVIEVCDTQQKPYIKYFNS